MDDDAQGQRREVLWERELDARILTGEDWEAITARGFDPPKQSLAFFRISKQASTTSSQGCLHPSPRLRGIIELPTALQIAKLARERSLRVIPITWPLRSCVPIRLLESQSEPWAWSADLASLAVIWHGPALTSHASGEVQEVRRTNIAEIRIAGKRQRGTGRVTHAQDEKGRAVGGDIAIGVAAGIVLCQEALLLEAVPGHGIVGVREAEADDGLGLLPAQFPESLTDVGRRFDAPAIFVKKIAGRVAVETTGTLPPYCASTERRP